VDSGVVIEDIELAEFLDASIHKPGQVGHLSDIGLDGDGAAPCFFDFSHNLVSGIFIAMVVHDDFGAMLSEQDGRRSSHSAGRTRYDRNLILQFLIGNA
jgi:hypothetical protein